MDPAGPATAGSVSRASWAVPVAVQATAPGDRCYRRPRWGDGGGWPAAYVAAADEALVMKAITRAAATEATSVADSITAAASTSPLSLLRPRRQTL